MQSNARPAANNRPAASPRPAVNNQPAASPRPAANTRPAAAPAANIPQSPPRIHRNRVPVRGTPLVRGQKWSVADKNGNMPSSLKICVGWDISDSRVQLDASAFMLKENGKVPGEEWFIFYSQTESPDRSVSYRSNDQNPNAPDDAEMYIDLGKVSSDIQKIAICVTIYEAAANRLHFGMVSNVYTRKLDGRGDDLADFVFSDCSPQVTAMVVGELYRYKDTWKFSATGSGVRRELAEFCAMYGVDII